ncbi:adenylate/guanylate cyclase domain-containing protein [Ferrovibrio sp.]|uniref:adenylate/guanylate cyclase domain-containing protein n=1 Tax=Ferrovibrio sp. TaxID=1917215 RepID=UPI0025C6578E|nr:adenylate/guanylate cyclase domain-containing protein [Ferrovibrio sp.]MBX3453286.1 adenylate/guanylate cyclase domain-containing protein [Ferrovibrio sp.]
MALWQKMHDMICGEDCRSLPDNERARLTAAYASEEYEGLRLAIGLRFVVLAIVALMVSLEMRWPMSLNFYPYIIALGLSGYLQLLLRRPGTDRPWMHWVFPLFDMAMVGAAIAMPNPFDVTPLPPPMRLGFDTILYLTLFLSLSVLGQSARMVFISTIAAIAVWMAATFYVALQPGVDIAPLNASVAQMPLLERLSWLTDPWRMSYGEMARRLVLLGMIGGVLTIAVIRGRHLVARQIETERARRNLARHFSPHMAEELARMDDPLGAVKQQEAAVLFADLVGFTRLTDEMTPQQTIALLREVHRRLAQAVFEQQGTLDKYLGDGIMASFGTPSPGPRDASAALLAARAMQAGIEQLNAQRALMRMPPLQLAIGIHYGPVTLGNIGDENRVEYALVGETVNVAHRLEQMTRNLNASICLSQAFVDRLMQEVRNDPGPLGDMTELRPQPIRGLREMMPIWIQPRHRGDAPSEAHNLGSSEAHDAAGALPSPTIH